MASFSSTYDVFISFRHEDTANNFTSHLHAALQKKTIETFMDDGDLKRGDDTSQAPSRAIEGSKLFLIIFSNEFASQKSCLDNLEKIMECKRKTGRTVIPVFYHVDPSDVRKQTGSFAVAFAKHEEDIKDKVQRWREALKEAANLSGWDSSMTRPESTLVDQIVQDVLEKLKAKSSSILKGLVGIDSRIKKIYPLLSIESPDFRRIGIWGMGGIGKTTIAGAIFNQISSKFEGCCFLRNVREQFTMVGAAGLTKVLISSLLGDNVSYGDTPFVEPFIRDRLQRKRVLIVFDDVDDSGALRSLLGGIDCLGPGSRIIITTRDKEVLFNCNVEEVYGVEKLNDDEALRLFCQHAFEARNNMPPEDFIGLSRAMIFYAQGLPLALEVLGSSLRCKNKQYWESASNKLKKVPKPKIFDALKISYDGLEEEEKNIFLDIACFFKGGRKCDVTEILNAMCYYGVNAGISDLVDKSLITISEFGNIEMHDLLQEMGRNIVNQESDSPEERSRLWNPYDIVPVLSKNIGSKNVKGVMLDTSRIEGQMKIHCNAFSKMDNLKFLKITNFHGNGTVILPQGLKSLPNKLRCFRWDQYPLKSLPSSLYSENLVQLSMGGSRLKKLWSGTQNLVNLKKLELSGSYNLVEVPDLSQATDLEYLHLEYCRSLVEVPSSIQHLNKLKELRMSCCEKLRSLPSDINLESLELLDLGFCTDLAMFPDISLNIRRLYLRGTSIQEVPTWIERFSALERLDLVRCKRLKSLPGSIFKSVKRFSSLQGCSKLEIFPEILEEIKSVYSLDLSGTAIKELPTSFKNLINLKELKLEDCKNLAKLPDSLGDLKNLRCIRAAGTALKQLPSTLANLTNLECLEISACRDRESKPLPLPLLACFHHVCFNVLGCEGQEPRRLLLPRLSSLHRLGLLDLQDLHIDELPDDIGCLSSLTYLDIRGNNFETLPASIKQLPALEELNVSKCKRLKSLPELPKSLNFLNAQDCTSLETVSGIGHKDNWNGYTCLFSNCCKLDHNSRRSILENVEQMLSDLAETSNQPGAKEVEVCLPGSKIPEWFCHQNWVPSGTLHRMTSNERFNLLFAVCFVIGFEEDNCCRHFMSKDFSFSCGCDWKTKDGESLHSFGPSSFVYNLSSIRSDHILIKIIPFHTPTFQDEKFYPGNISSTESSFDCRIEYSGYVKDCEMKSLGVDFLCEAEEYDFSSWEG